MRNRRDRLRRGLTTAVTALGLAAAWLTPAQAAEGTLPSGNTGYRTLADYQADMDGLVRDHPDLVKPLTLPYETTSGRKVRGIEISRDVQAKDGKPVFVTVGMHHGNEWPSGELTLEYAMDVVENADRPEFSKLLDRARLVVVPIVNVDGFVANTRHTANGTDMNRDYGFGWLPGSTTADQPWTEPESRNIQWLLSTRQATTFVTQHTCIQVVLYPPTQLAAGDTQDVARFADLGGRMAESYGPTYKALDSAHDYETTGEAIDWAYYATRGLAFTNETCPDAGVERTYDTQVTAAYPGHRKAMLHAWRNTADPAQHATIDGRAPKGAVLRIEKEFPMYTQPFKQADGSKAPAEFPAELSSELEVTGRGGEFRWAVNPSERPVPPYQKDGVHGGQTGFLPESWTLTCAKPDGTVLQKSEVRVGLGEKTEVDLAECRREFR